MAQDALSALLDGECSDQELDRLLEQLDQDPALGQQWSRLCAARESESGTRIVENQRCICAGVMAALGEQPEAGAAKVVDLAVRRASSASRLRPALRRYWKPVAGFAAAAGMGAAAVLLVQPQSQDEDLQVIHPGQIAYQPGSQDALFAEQFRDYAIDHSNSISGGTVGGTLSYARFVAHPVAYQPAPGEQP